MAIIIILLITSLILGGTFFVISQNKSGQSLANKSISVSSNSINYSSSSSQNSSFQSTNSSENSESLISISSQNTTSTNFKLTYFSDNSIKKATLDNITQDPNSGLFMKDCLAKNTIEPLFRKEIIYSKVLNKNYIKVNFGSVCYGNAGTHFGIIKVDPDGNASFLLEPNGFPLYDMKVYLSPSSDKIALEKTYKFIGCVANSYLSVIDLKTDKEVYYSALLPK